MTLTAWSPDKPEHKHSSWQTIDSTFRRALLRNTAPSSQDLPEVGSIVAYWRWTARSGKKRGGFKLAHLLGRNPDGKSLRALYDPDQPLGFDGPETAPETLESALPRPSYRPRHSRATFWHAARAMDAASCECTCQKYHTPLAHKACLWTLHLSAQQMDPSCVGGFSPTLMAMSYMPSRNFSQAHKPDHRAMA